MKKYRTTKKLLSLVLCVLMAFSAVSVSAADNEAEAVGDHEHIPGAFTVEESATCTTPGRAKSKCMIEGCDEVVTKILPVDPGSHKQGDLTKKKEATCMTDGFEKRVCSECHKSYTVILKRTGHTFDEDNWVVTVEALHTISGNKPLVRAGKKINTCTVEGCGNVVEINYDIPHEVDESASGKPGAKATCVTKGTVWKSCKLCQSAVAIETDYDLSEEGHKYNAEPHIISSGYSCKNDGVGVVVCEYCEDIKTVNVPKEDAHKYLPWKVTKSLPSDATCNNTKYGLEEKICPTCGESVATRAFYAQHTLADGYSGVVANCTEEGYLQGYCTVCRSSVAKNVLPVDNKNHLWWPDVELRPATCTETGAILRRCKKNASHVEIIEIEKLDHVYNTEWTVVTPATCKQDGLKKNTCVTCNNVIEEVIPKSLVAHVFDETDVKYISAPDCDKEGKIEVRCTVCNNYYSRVLPKHSQKEKVVVSKAEPTCSKEGSIVRACVDCSTRFTEVIPVNESAHVLDPTYIVIQEPTCCTKGIKVQKCVKCRKEVESSKVEIEATGEHIVGEWQVEKYSTCTETGTNVRYCVNHGKGCNFSERIDTTNTHNFTAWSYSDDGDGNCKSPVTRYRVCLHCNATETDTYAPHVPGAKVFVCGNCESGGDVQIKCALCDEGYDMIFNVPAGNHLIDYYNGEDFELTAAEKDKYCGAKKFTCQACNETIITKVDHSYIVVSSGGSAKQPTCTEAGYTPKKWCKNCTYTIEETYPAPLGHDFVWGESGTKVCVVCGIFETEIEDEDGNLVVCDHFCHNNSTVSRILLKILTFFWKIFGTNQTCECGAVHYEIEAKK